MALVSTANVKCTEIQLVRTE
uniref:Uncharacterized protein n=1 Tax=Anguilla anguilla TaxID=7936 RepID=A0A0E9TU81_ANGAN